MNKKIFPNCVTSERDGFLLQGIIFYVSILNRCKLYKFSHIQTEMKRIGVKRANIVNALRHSRIQIFSKKMPKQSLTKQKEEKITRDQRNILSNSFHFFVWSCISIRFVRCAVHSATLMTQVFSWCFCHCRCRSRCRLLPLYYLLFCWYFFLLEVRLLLFLLFVFVSCSFVYVFIFSLNFLLLLLCLESMQFFWVLLFWSICMFIGDTHWNRIHRIK